MNQFVLISGFITCALTLTSQTGCNNKLDTSEVIKIAEKKDAYWTDSRSFKPKIIFNAINCEWTVESIKTRYTNEGKCKHTNGCTEISKVKLIIDARTRKVKRRTSEKELKPNYE